MPFRLEIKDTMTDKAEDLGLEIDTYSTLPSKGTVTDMEPDVNAGTSGTSFPIPK